MPEPSKAKAIQSPLRDMRLPPQNPEAERALLGSILLRPDSLSDILDALSPKAFYLTKNEIIFDAMLELFSQGTPIDILTLTSRLKELKKLEKVGGMEYLVDLSHAVPSAANIEYYAEIVQKKFLCRSLIDAANDVCQFGYDEAEELGELLDKAEKRIYEVSGLLHASDYVSIGKELKGAFERLDKLHASGSELRGVPTGFKSLDNMLSGFQRSDLIILAARPSVGKTSFALDIARQTAKLGSSVLVFSLEMAAQQLVDRMIASESRVDAWKLRTGRVSRESDFTALTEAGSRLAPLKIFIDDQAGNNVLGMRSTARKVKRESGLDLLVVDYLQLMLPSGRFKNSDSLVQQVTEISRSLKILARELDVPVLALSQLSRAVEQRGGKPRLSDLRDSGSIEQDADVVMFIHREDKYKSHEEREQMDMKPTEILIEKHRNGPVGKVDLMFDDRRATFMNMEISDFDSMVGGSDDAF